MVMLNVNDRQLARIAETLSSTQKDVELANRRALISVNRKAGSDARRRMSQQGNLKPRRTKASVGGRKVNAEHYIVFISGRPASVDAHKGVRPKLNKSVTYKGKTFPRSFYQYGKRGGKLLPLARVEGSRTSLDYLTVELLPVAIKASKEVQGNTAANYSKEFERVLVSRRRHA